ncbi:hypothetical protein NCAS_0G03940 [Naumovozyma castellii]|uniref:Protein BOP3 n=1 Tax=Naumovozyma castellii TaxID=27288 RepID=G0VHH5_NAUCA|nr:hypothetical protein NCAS_0G03940 [Naumovozyma castellii CBS 4309]CCC71281.1 hypothetical protein NCAS_0G03940 [Naumovozyma castellii CBS 4309]
MNTPNNNPVHYRSPSNPGIQPSSVSKSFLESIFGDNVSIRELPEQTVLKSLDLKIEQERTKQQYYKLQNVTKSIELFKLASSSGVPPNHIYNLFSNADQLPQGTANSAGITNDLQPAQNSIRIKKEPTQPSVYKFPPISIPNNNNNSSNGLSSPLPSSRHISKPSFQRRTNSPARIGAHAVAALSESILLKENPEESNMEERSKFGSPLPIRKINYNPNTSTIHNRNLSLPTLTTFTNNMAPRYKNLAPVPTSNNNNASTANNNNSNSPYIPSEMVSILSFENSNKNDGDSDNKKLGPMGKRQHKRARSTCLPAPSLLNPKTNNTSGQAVSPSYGVIDLNVIDESNKRRNVIVKRMQTPVDNHNNNNNTTTNGDETCSEASSNNNSPIQKPRGDYGSSVNRLLNAA